MSTYEKYFQAPYIQMMRKQAAQPPMGADPATGGMPMDQSMMGGVMPPDAAMMGGMPPAGDPTAAMGGMPQMDPATMQAMMAGMPPAPAPVDPAATDPAAAEEAVAPKTSKQQKEELMNNIQASLESIQDYVYNNLMILIQVAKALNVAIPAEMLVAPPNGKNMDIMSDPAAIAAAGGEAAPAAPPLGAPAPTDLPPAEQAPSDAKIAMFRLAGIPSKQVDGHQIKKAMDYLVNREKHDVIDTMHKLIGGSK